MKTREDLAGATRTAATLAAMIALAVTAVAPADDVATRSPATTQASTMLASTMPATTMVAVTTAPATTMTTTIVVNVPAAAASRPVVTEADVLVARERGDLIGHVVNALGNTGVRETFVRTQWFEWFYALLAMAAGVVAGRLVSRVFDFVGARAAERVNLVRAVVLHAFAGPVSLLVTAIGLAVGLHFLDFTPAAQLALQTGFQLLFLVIVGWLLYNLVEIVSLVLLRLSRGRQGNLSVMLVPIVRRVLRATILVFLTLFALNNLFAIQLPSLLAGVGIAGLAVSLAAQDTLKNLFGSVMIFADQPFLMGDLVRVDAFEGVVEDIGFRSTRIRTAEGFLISIPNGKVADASVTNLSRRKATRRVLDVALPYDSTPEQVDVALATLRAMFADASIAADFDARRGEPTVALDEFRPNGIRLRATYWFRGVDAAEFAAHAERVNRLVLDRFAAKSIRFAMSA